MADDAIFHKRVLDIKKLQKRHLKAINLIATVGYVEDLLKI